MKAVCLDFLRKFISEVKEVDRKTSRAKIWGLFFHEVPSYFKRRSTKVTFVVDKELKEYKYRLIKGKKDR